MKFFNTLQLAGLAAPTVAKEHYPALASDGGLRGNQGNFNPTSIDMFKKYVGGLKTLKQQYEEGNTNAIGKIINFIEAPSFDIEFDETSKEEDVLNDFDTNSRLGQPLGSSKQPAGWAANAANVPEGSQGNVVSITPLLTTVRPEACGDDPNWHKHNRDDRGCSYVAQLPENRCVWTDANGIPATEACKEACGLCDLFQCLTNEDIKSAVNDYISQGCAQDSTCEVGQTYGHPMNTWCTEGVTSMDSLFKEKSTFNEDISDWDTSSLMNLRGAFQFATEFNGDLSKWDVSKVFHFGGVFQGAIAFNRDISGWNVSSGMIFPATFGNAESFNQDLTNWDTSSATIMPGMFNHAKVFNGDVSTWNISRVSQLRWMFGYAESFNIDISGWDVSSVTDSTYIFESASAFNQNLCAWGPKLQYEEFTGGIFRESGCLYDETPKTREGPFCASMCPVSIKPFDDKAELQAAIDKYFLQDCVGNSGECDIGVAYGYPMNTWDVSQVTDMSGLLLKKMTFNEDISSWNTASATTMNDMFKFAREFNQDVGGWDVSKVTNFNSMFWQAASWNADLASWNTSSAQDFATMFKDTAKFTGGDLSAWDTSEVTNMVATFFQAHSFNSDLSGWNTSKVTIMRGAFHRAYEFNSDISGWDISSVTISPYMLQNATSFNQNLCAWAPKFSYINAPDIFTGSGCAFPVDPEAATQGPFCASDCS